MPLKPASSTLARRTMKSAFDDIKSTIAPDDSRNFDTTTLEDVKTAALDIENQMAARQELRNMRRLMPLFQGMEHYSHVIEILCNGTPYLSWIWAPISLILRIASEYIDAFEQVIRGYARISESLERFSTLSKAFSKDADFQQTLAVFYSDIMLFHKHAYQFVRRNSWKLFFLTSWGRFQRRLDNLLDDMKHHEKLIDLQANASNIAEAKKMREDIKVWKEESLANIRQLNEKESTKQYESIVAWLKADESDQLGILDTISSESSQLPGTCSWVLKNPKIRSWFQRSPDTSVLWLQGKPGSGKSVLAAEIMKFMRASNQFVICHFCSQRFTSSVSYHQILRSFLLQLLRSSDEIIAYVYKDCVLGRKPPTIQALEKLILALFKIALGGPRQINYIWIVLDGLNECEPRQQTSVVSFLNQLTGKTASGSDTICKILMSSRRSTTIPKRLRLGQVVSLSEEQGIKLAIMQYVSHRLRLLHDKLRQLKLSRKETEELARVITNKADVQLDPRSVERLRSIFGWIAFAKRPLKRLEFLSALTFASGVSTNKSLVPSFVLDVCGPLVEERPDTTLTFIHDSVKEFLRSAGNFRITEKEAVLEQCVSNITCLLSGFEYLIDGPKETRAMRVVKGIHGLHVYATEFWTENLLHYASMGDFNFPDHLVELTDKLANKLEEYTNFPVGENSHLGDISIDTRLEFLKEWPLLSKHVQASLLSRGLKHLESNILREMNNDTVEYSQDKPPNSNLSATQNSQEWRYSAKVDGISTLLSLYQEITVSLLQQNHFPGVSLEEFELWKTQFRASAFTCRFGFCPRATEGFPSEDLRRQHEIAHTQLAICTVPDCKYPPFSSVRALKSHMDKCHLYKPRRRPIRSSGSLVVKDREVAILRNPAETSSPVHVTIKFQDNIWHKNIEKRKRGSEDNSNQQRFVGNQVYGVANQEAITDGIAIDESTFPKTNSMGYRYCIFVDGNGLCSHNFSSNNATPEDWNQHYLTWHHADIITRCADHRCQMVFANEQCLEAHYVEQHTALFCTLCVENKSEGYRLEQDLIQHWMSTHIWKVKRWMCDDPVRIEDCLPHGVVPIISFGECLSCANRQKYERKDDAMKHLVNFHFQLGSDNLQDQMECIITPFIVGIWVYEVDSWARPLTLPESEVPIWHVNELGEEGYGMGALLQSCAVYSNEEYFRSN
ncbi:hypothetical protein O1611_g5011 [Lasiodiplodia mahajangana]|uniref:Uncharacterized protein n=1 Tax=Lasiodiplodia mahajangana TaxID=1108764 RepID=A0ACC2JMJ9_9PEZI|nr:hypothetical protein O1611_g5011 [Lasiodiplodia mahajangana]